jgi:hypothetical protein
MRMTLRGCERRLMTQPMSSHNRPRSFPLWLKAVCCALVAFHLCVNLRFYGPLNYLWFCDIGLLTGTIALCLESRLLLSMTAISVLGPATAWTFDYLFCAFTGRYPIGIASYMSDVQLPVSVRVASTFHIWLPFLLIWMLSRIGYDRRALLLQTLFAIAILVICRTLTAPPPARSIHDVVNINSVYGNSDIAAVTTFPAWAARYSAHLPFPWLRVTHETNFPGWLYITWIVTKFWIGMYLPTHLLAVLCFDRRRQAKVAEAQPATAAL